MISHTRGPCSTNLATVLGILLGSSGEEKYTSHTLLTNCTMSYAVDLSISLAPNRYETNIKTNQQNLTNGSILTGKQSVYK